MTDTNIATIQNKPPIVVMKERAEARKPEIASALKGSGVSPDQFIRALITSATINPELQACSWSSLWLECMKACRDGLLPDGVDGAIVPFKSTAKWIPMYRGLLKKFRQSGQCKWIGSNVVRAGEPFEHFIDENGEHFKHIPGDNDSATIVRVYAAAMTKDGAFYTAIMSMTDIAKIRTESRASRDDAPWKKWPEEMMKKTALRRLAKLLPSGYVEDDDDLPAVADSPPSIPTIPAAEYAERTRRDLNRDPIDQLANAPTSNGGPVTPVSTAGEQDGGGPSEMDSPPRTDDAAAVSSDDPSLVEVAYQRGHKDKEQGMSRKAIPPEYREPQRSREALSWQAGFDNKPRPTWSS